MQGDKRIDELMLPVLNAINRHVKDGDAKTDIYNRAYEAIIISMEENSELREQVRWIPVGERLPELQDPCLVIYRSIDAISAIGLRYRQDVLDGYVWIDEDGLASPADNVTHWKPLPSFPERED